MGYPPHLDLRCPEGNSDNPALDVLERAANDSGSPRVQRVLDRARGDVDRNGASARDYVRALEVADGELAIISWTNAYFASIGYVGCEFDCWAYSKIDEMMRGPESATTYSRLAASDVRDEIRDRDPLVILRDRTQLDEGVTL